MRMAGVRDADPAAVVEVALAVGGDQPRPLAAIDDEIRDPAPHGRDDREVGWRGRAAGRRWAHRWRIDRHRGALPRRSVVSATNATADRNTMEPTTLICAGSALRMI